MAKGSGRRRLGAAALAVLASALFVAEGVGSVASVGLPVPATLLSVSVAPTGATVAAGETQQFTATGTYSDLTTQNLTASVTWSSSDAAVATISNAGAPRAGPPAWPPGA